MTIKLPRSTLKYMLSGESGLRVNGEAVDAFSAKILEFAELESKRIIAAVLADKRKTIYEYDVNVDEPEEVSDNDVDVYEE